MLKRRVRMKHTNGYVVQQSPGAHVAYILNVDGQCGWGIAVRHAWCSLRRMRSTQLSLTKRRYEDVPPHA